MERFDLYNKHLEKLNKTMVRGASNNSGEYHLVVHIWIRNNDRQYLIQQRNKQDDLVPYQWGTHGGAVLEGETSLEAAIRETKEEIGIALNPNKLELVKRYVIDHPHSNYITDLYLYEDNILLNECKIDTVEVRDIAYKSFADIQQMISQNTFWDYEHLLERHGYFDELEKR